MLLNRIAVKVAFFLNGFIYANWVSRLPRIQELYEADNGTIGLVLLTFSLGAVAAMPFTGWVVIRYGSRKITLFSLIGYCAFVPLIAGMQNIPALMMLFVVMGAFTGMLDVAMNAQAVMVERAYRKPIMTSFHALFSIGMALGAWCGALFADLQFDISVHFGVTVSASLITCIWVSRNLVYDKPIGAEGQEGPVFRLPSKSLVIIGVIAFCCMMGEGAMADWTVNFMENVADASRTMAPIGLSAFATAMTIGRVFGDRIRIAFGDSMLIMAGGVISTLGLAAALIVPDTYISISGFFLVGLGLSTIVPIAYSIAGNAKGLPSGVGLAMVTTVGYAGFLFGPPIIGFIADVYGLRVGLAFVLLLFVLMTLLGALRHRNDARDELL
ncbi:MAG TPA: MFS transporter [Chryseosolibacter sp.]|nr:MFS transporter [Chryseosolibacter sp.]